MTKEELVKFLIKNFEDATGDIDLTELDFGNRRVNLSFLKARNIANRHQRATDNIYNDYQKAEVIYNDHQEAENIINSYQEAKEEITNNVQEADLCITNMNQNSKKIINMNQKAKKIYN